MAVSFGDFAFDQERRQLLLSGKPVPLETKAYELLGLLLSRRPNALSKEQIRIPDAQAPTGWKLEPGPFPGWQRLPAW